MAMGEDVYCTLVMSDAYLPGAAVLAHCLRDARTKKKLACLVTQESLRASTMTELQSLYDYVIPIERIGNPNPANLYLMNRPDLLYTFTKIHLWRLTQFRKVVYIDSDVVALRAPDELFDIEEEFAAAPDVGWPDAFNTGVMILAPHMGDYWALRTLAGAGDSFDGADQGLLNQYFEHRPWKRLSFTYNCTPSGNYQYEPAYRYHKSNISMVHFIGNGKPWQQGRAVKSAPGAYQELLSRWWAVYDRHYRVSSWQANVVQREVKGEMDSSDHGYYATGYPVGSTQPATTTDAPFTEPTHQGELLNQGIIEPTPTAQQRKFSAPTMEWDATRGAPPATSRPEASGFPRQTYKFTTDRELFKPPTSYPEPPRDNLWYDVPRGQPKKEERPPPIFPWEEREVPPPSRKFLEDEPPAPPEPELEPEFAGADEFTVSVAGETEVEPKTPAVLLNDDAPWQAFGAVNRNAWDEVGGIDDYVRALTAFQKNRGKVEVLHNYATADTQQQELFSPAHESEPAELIDRGRERRESLLLTDFPSAVERPSLPVTPAPRRRATFWGSERDEEGALPGAEGVPDQADWDPNTQLEQLRRNSLLGPGDLKLPATSKKDIPNRRMPSTAELIPEESHVKPHGLDQPPLGGGSESVPAVPDAAEKNAAKAAPTFSEPVFSAPASSGEAAKEAVLSPSETAE